MKKLLLILVLLLVPMGVVDACPGKRGPCGGGCAAQQAAVDLVAIPDMAQQMLDTTENVAMNAMQGFDAAARNTGGLVQEIQFDGNVSDTDAQQVAEAFQKGVLLMRLATEDLDQASKFALIATVEEGPVAVALKLRAAAYFTDATVKLNRARQFVLEAEKKAAVLLGIPIKNPC